MKLAVLYAGQGAQHPGMGKEFYEGSPAFRAAFDSAELDFDLHRVCFEDPDGLLNQTEYTQPCMVAFACGVTAVLAQQGVKPAYVAGLSLGEYSALEAAGVFTAKQAIELAAYRGKAMAEAAKGIDCGMTAVLNLDRQALAACCEQAAQLGCVQICNYNCPGQLVIGGEKAAVDKAAALAKEAGARRCIPLKVSGPFHTRLMAPAGDALAKRFASESFGEMQVPVLFNCLGREKADADPEGASSTFHGRDVMAPAAGQLAAGASLETLGLSHELQVALDFPSALITPTQVQAWVLAVDHFGNVTFDLGEDEGREVFAPGTSSKIGEQEVVVGHTYADVEVGKPLLLWGSQRLLELAVRQGSAAQEFQLREDEPVLFRRA